MNGKKFALLLLWAVSFQSVWAQEPVDALVARFSTFADNRPAEIIYLQTGKGIYEPGEDLWFKAYLLDAQTFSLSRLSQTLYLQMRREADKKTVWQEKYPIENGFADGHVYVSDTLPDGDYFLEAYTRHSFFADSTEMNAVRKVKVQKDMYKTEKVRIKADSSFRFETFPEGGNLFF
jgi:uncharacterized protein YfaS (alpha-2-macroglobulin family)